MAAPKPIQFQARLGNDFALGSAQPAITLSPKVQALLHADWDGVARLLREEWKLRRTNAPGITTPLIDKLIAVAGKHGGLAAKVCGAGGGGCVIFLVERGAASRVATAIGDNGGRVLPLQVARDGLRFTS